MAFIGISRDMVEEMMSKRIVRLDLVIAVMMVLIMVLPSALAIGANDTIRGPETKCLVFTGDPGVVGAMKAKGIDVLEQYGAFALVKGRMSDLKGFDIMETQYDLETVDLAEYTIDHRTGGEPDIPEGLRLGPEGYGASGHYIVQFYGPIKEQWLSWLVQKGADIDTYLPNNAYVVRMDKGTKDGVAASSRVQWVGPYQPAYKVQTGLLDVRGTVDVHAIIFDDADLGKALFELSQFAEIVFIDTTTHIKVGLDLDAEDIPRLAHMDAVKWIERRPYWVSYSQVASWIIQSAINGQYPLYDQGIHGENQTVFNTDTGIVVAHEAYHDASRSVQYSSTGGNTPPDLQHRKIVNYWTFADSTDAGGWTQYHGTHTNGVTAGDATPNSGTFHGIAWAAKISFGDIFYSGGGNGIPANLNTLFQKGYNDGARVSSNSWGMWGSAGIYDSQAQEVDEFMWNNRDILILYSAGNDGSSAGTVSTPATGKNVMAVGAAEHTVDGDMMGYSSRGPTDDGRLKPTLYTPTDETGPCGGSSCGATTYDTAGGTSNSCPAAAGGMLLLRQYYTDGFYPTGTKVEEDAFNPSAALLRATAINGAEETQGVDAHDHPYNSMLFPNNDQGWGYMNLDSALFFDGDEKMLFIDDHTAGLSTGQEVEYFFSVKDSNIPIEITLAWTDYPGATGAGTEMVNNLDMTVTGPDATEYKGNVWKTSGTPHESAPGGAYDGKNVEENFMLVNPPTGAYTVKVTAANVAQGAQDFALVATGNFVREPDLAVLKKEVSVEPIGVPAEGETVYINGTVHNYGGLVSSIVPMEFFIDDEKVETRNLDFTILDKQAFAYTWTAEAGFHNFSVKVDPADVIEEGDEDNNYVRITRYFNGRPKANMTVTPEDPLTKDSVTVDASESTDDGFIAWYRFEFGDGSKTNWVKTPTSSHVYNDNGQFVIQAWVKDNMSVISDPVEYTIEVHNRLPTVNATASVYEAYTFFEIAFDGARSTDLDGSITWLWDFGDGTTSDEKRPMHNWSDDGLYLVNLTVTDDDGATNTTTLDINVLNQHPSVFFETSVISGNVTTPIECNATAWDKDGVISEWSWDFGDGNTSDEEDPIYYYGNDGEYIISLYVLDDDGAISNIMNKSVVIVNLPPLANISMSSDEAPTFTDIRFFDMSKDLDGYIISHTWSMGDGKYYTDPSPTHQYKENGVYTVRLTVQDDDGDSASFETFVVITNRPPEAKAIFNSTVYVGELVTFTANESTDMDGMLISFDWAFTDNETKRGETVSYAYWEPGTHNFTLRVTDNDGSTDTIDLSITVIKKPKPPKRPIGEDLGSIFSLLMIVIVIAGVVGGVLFGAIYMKRKRPSAHKSMVDKVADVPPPVSGEAHTRDSGFSEYQYPAYGNEVEGVQAYGETYQDHGYETSSGETGDQGWHDFDGTDQGDGQWRSKDQGDWDQ